MRWNISSQPKQFEKFFVLFPLEALIYTNLEVHGKGDFRRSICNSTIIAFAINVWVKNIVIIQYQLYFVAKSN